MGTADKLKSGLLIVSLGYKRRALLWNVIESARRYCPELPVHVVSDVPVDVPFTWVRCPLDLPFGSRYYKTWMYNLSPFSDITLYIDDDTGFHRPIPSLEETLGDADVALCPEHGGYTTIGSIIGRGWHSPEEESATLKACGKQFPYWNTGVIIFRRTPRSEKLFESWRLEWMRFQAYDQPAFARAVASVPDVSIKTLGHEWNTRTNRCKKTTANPYIFHFWNVAQDLCDLEWYQNQHGFRAEPHMAYRAFCRAVDHGLCTRSQYEVIGRIICRRRPCNLLVFGCGADSGLWRELNRAGRTLFIEDNETWAAPTVAAGCEVHMVRYPTLKGMLREDVPSPIPDIGWDIVLIGGTPGMSVTAPGRQLPIQWASKISGSPVIILHDYERPWERWCADRYLGAPCFVSSLSGSGQMAFWNLDSADIAAMLR